MTQCQNTGLPPGGPGSIPDTVVIEFSVNKTDVAEDFSRYSSLPLSFYQQSTTIPHYISYLQL